VAAVAEKTGGQPIEIWFGDEARIGQKNKITRRWAKRGTRPSAPRDQRTASAYIFGAICPQDGKGAALVLPSCNTEAMALHLEESPLQWRPARTPAFAQTPAMQIQRLVAIRRPQNRTNHVQLVKSG
jgi:DDE superfamily endonuclease